MQTITNQNLPPIESDIWLLVEPARLIAKHSVCPDVPMFRISFSLGGEKTDLQKGLKTGTSFQLREYLHPFRIICEVLRIQRQHSHLTQKHKRGVS